MHTRLKLLLGSGTLAVAFLGGVALAPGLVGSAAAQFGGQPTGAVARTGGGLGLTTDRRDGHEGDLFKAAAAYIGIGVGQLRSEMGTDKSMADVAIAHGKTRDGLVQALTAGAQTRIERIVDHKGFPAERATMEGLKAGIKAASDYLGISPKDLMTQLRSGKSLGQIADATTGKSRQGLIDAVVAAETKAIDQAVASGKLTQAQADKITSNLTTRVTTFVDATHTHRDGRRGEAPDSQSEGR